ncbi:MAG TPA: CvpA family protein [Candidatus Limnocylindrales bacterium]|nr:CvpA family protein [Candidatus Limnocylindrales bacterium]
MNIGEILGSINRFDLLVVLFLFGMFVLGFIQGTIRRVLGLASMLFSFLFAANLRGPLGGYLANNWNDYPDEYAVMLGFAIVFVAATIAFTIVIQGFYHKQDLFKRATFADEMIGGFLGIVQGLFLILAIIVILDSFFQIPTIPKSVNEYPWLRAFWDAIDTSTTGEIFRSRLIPGFITVFGLLIPIDLQAFYVPVSTR